MTLISSRGLVTRPHPARARIQQDSAEDRAVGEKEGNETLELGKPKGNVQVPALLLMLRIARGFGPSRSRFALACASRTALHFWCLAGAGVHVGDLVFLCQDEPEAINFPILMMLCKHSTDLHEAFAICPLGIGSE
jgi:hypothetical protein